MPNQVTLTFAGDASGAQAAFSQVGKSSQDMAEQSHQASQRMADGFDYASSQSSMLSGGIGDVGGALTAAFGEDSGIGQVGAEMEKYGTIIMGVTGISDLLLFATNNLKLATLAKAGADRVAAAAQWLMNTALLASPITWIIVGIVALIAVIVLIATKTNWFQRAWRASWDWIKKAASNTWDFLKKIPGWIGSAFSTVARFISAPYKAAFNAIARAWNSTIGRLSFTFPDWVPGFGGKGFSVPNLPTFHAGGVIPGVVGTAVPILGLAGERVSGPASRGGGDGQWVRVDAGALGEALMKAVAGAVKANGGSVTQLGVKVVGGTVR